MPERTPRVVPFADRATQGTRLVGRVHRDGSITFGGRTYRTIKDLPPECVALHPDADTWAQWRRLYRAIDPTPKRRRGGAPLHLFLIPLLLLALAAGCGPGPETSALMVPEGFDACEVLTFQEARAIAGRPIAGLSSTFDDAVGRNPLECAYNAGTVENPLMVSLQIRPASSARAAERRIESNRSFLRNLSGGNVEDVSGVGDVAIWAGGRAQQLHVSKGAVQLIVTVQSGKEPLESAKKIADKTFAAMAEAARQGKPPQTA